MKPHSLLLLMLCEGYVLVGGVALAADIIEASPATSQDVKPNAALPELVPRTESLSAAESQPKLAEPQSGVAPVDPNIVALQQRIEQLELAGAEQLVPKLETFRLYGWIDAGTSKMWLKDTDPANMLVATRSNTFLVGNVNLYFDFQPTENWTSLVEVRLTNLPTTKGTESSAMAAPTTMSSDQAVVDPTASMISYPYLSPVVLERAYISYRWNDHFQFRIGKFLTPFGIWNVDHGAPTRIAVSVPMFMVQSLYPTSQVGAQIFGVVQTGNFEIGYVAYASNGRDPDVSKTGNPMYGGRVQIRTSVPWRLQLGFSGLTGRLATEANVSTDPTTMKFNYATTSAYRETDIGVDLSVDIGRLRLRTECARGSRTYEPGLRAAGMVSGTYMANSVVTDVYTIAAYRLPWLELEPYGSMEIYRDPGFGGEGFLSPSVGLNIYFTAAAQFKIQYNAHYFYKDFLNGERAPSLDKKILMTRFVLGF